MSSLKKKKKERPTIGVYPKAFMNYNYLRPKSGVTVCQISQIIQTIHN